jgi:hypothetical protein
MIAKIIKSFLLNITMMREKKVQILANTLKPAREIITARRGWDQRSKGNRSHASPWIRTEGAGIGTTVNPSPSLCLGQKLEGEK